MLDFSLCCLQFAYILGDIKNNSDVKNPRFSTTSSTEGEEILDQLVVAEVHHEPIMEIKETGTITDTQ